MYLTAIHHSIEASRRGNDLGFESINLANSVTQLRTGSASSERDAKLKDCVQKTCILAKEGYNLSKEVLQNFLGVRQALMKESITSIQICLHVTSAHCRYFKHMEIRPTRLVSSISKLFMQ